MKRWLLLAGLVLGPWVMAAETHPGLFQSDSEATLAKAKANGRPVMIDFFGVWCPPCNQLKETVFITPGFLERAKSFELLEVDADKPSSWKLKDRYKIGGYPTILFLNPKGEELYRIVGYRAPDEFNKVMDLVLASKGRPATKACQSKNEDDLWRCALTCMEKKDHPCAQKAIGRLEAKLKPRTARFEIARSYQADRAENVDLKKRAFESLLRDYPDSPFSLIWALSYWEAALEQKATPDKALLTPVLEKYPTMAADRRREELGLPVSDLAQLRAQVVEKLGDPEATKRAWKEAAEVLAELATQLPAGVTDRGYKIEEILCLDSAGETEKALKLAETYQVKYPSEFTFHYIAATILEKRKKFGEAVPIAKKAYEASYGDNRIRAGILLMTLYGATANKDAAKQIYLDVKKEIQPDAKLDVRTHRYLKRLDEVWGQVQKA